MLTCFGMQCFLFLESPSLLPTLTSAWRTAPPAWRFNSITSFSIISSLTSPIALSRLDHTHLHTTLCRWLLEHQAHCTAINFVQVSLPPDGEQLSSFYFVSPAVSGTWELLNICLLGKKKKKKHRQTNWLELVSVPPPSRPEIIP